MGKKTTLCILVGSLAVTATVTAFCINNLSFVPAKSDVNFTMNLNEGNAPTTSTDFVDEVISTKIPSTTLTYRKVKALNGGHCVLNAGGEIVKNDIAKGLASVRAIFTGSLSLNTANVESGYTSNYPLTSGEQIPLCGNYFAFKADSETSITSLEITYNCTIEGVDHDYTQGHTSENDFAGYYVCRTCGHKHVKNTFYSWHGDNVSYEGQMNSTEYQFSFNNKANNYITYFINSPIDQTATLVGLFCARLPQFQNYFSDCLELLVNDHKVNVDGVKMPNNNEDWFHYYNVTLGTVNLKAGANAITIRNLTDDSAKNYNIAAIAFSNLSQDLSWYDYSGAKETTRFEAEDGSWYSEYCNVRDFAGASGNKIVGGINEGGVFNPGEYYLILDVNASEATTATLKYGISSAGVFDIGSCLPTVKADRRYFSKEKTNGAGWDSYANYTYSKIHLNKGHNQIRIYMNEGCQCNADYFDIEHLASVSVTVSQLTNSLARTSVDADDSNGLQEKGGKCHGDNSLWRCNDDHGQYVGRVNDCASDTGKYWFEWNVTASEDCVIKAYQTLGLGLSPIQIKTLKISVCFPNTDKYLTVNTGYQANDPAPDWFNWREYEYGNIPLRAGLNKVRINIFTGAACNHQSVRFLAPSDVVIQ